MDLGDRRAADRFDSAFVGPLLPPPPPARPTALQRPEPTEALLAIPLAPRALAGQAFDLLTRSDSGLRGASFYIGFILAATVGPSMVLLALGILAAPGDGAAGLYDRVRPPMWILWLMLSGLPGFLGYVGASVDARGLAMAVIGGRAEGRPLRLRESIAVARARFWQLLAAQIGVGVVSAIVGAVATGITDAVVGQVDAIDTAISLFAALVVGVPFAYTAAGIVLGEAEAGEALRRSIRLARLRPRLAVTVTLFSVGSQFLVLLGVMAAAEASGLVATGLQLDAGFPLPLAVPVVTMLVFALGTLLFLAEAFTAAPAAYAFAALTHYTAGLETGRRSPVSVRQLWDPWFTPGLALCAIVALLALVGGVLSLNG